MSMTLEDLAALVDGEVVGDAGLRIAAVASAASAGPDTITFAESEQALEAALASGAGAVVAGREAAGPKPLVRAKNPRIAFVRIAEALHPEPRPAPGVHATAVVDESASIGVDAHVGPHAVVEAGVTIGDRTVIGPGSFLGAGTRIGADTRLHAHVSIYPGMTIGDRVILHCGVVIGADGFGYVDTKEGKVKFPQLGTVVVMADVEIGANTTIDRGALDATVIGAGTKIDNLVQIAHNVEIGRSCALSSQTGIAGTAKLGDWVVTGGHVGIADHARVPDRVVFGAMSGVPSGARLSPGSAHWGAPIRPLKEAKRLFVRLGRLGKLMDQVADLRRRVDALEGDAS